jgi:NADP-dependent 3-hydroxy acid dehydrogenase YdfG
MDRRLKAILTGLGGCAEATGISQGCLVVARELAETGAHVAIRARSEQELQRVREEFSGRGQELITEVCDVGVRAEIERCLQPSPRAIGCHQHPH